MRPLLALAGLVLAAIGVVFITSRYHNADKPLAERYAEEERQKAEDAQRAQATAKDNIPAPGNPEREKAFDKVKEGAIRVRLDFENRGTVVLELYPKAAPKTVAHFVDLTKQKFYDGVLVHRYVPGFVIQTGDPASKKMDPATAPKEETPQGSTIQGLGTGGSGTNVPLEAGLPHTLYSVGLARSQSPDSGDSQFYINLKDNDNLDGQYCVFGRVLEGQKVVDSIRLADRIKSLTIQ